MNKKDILIKTITNEIIPNNKNYIEKGIIISLKKNHLDIEYNNKKYIIKVKKKKNILYWYLYKKRQLIYKQIIDNNFNNIINIIEEHK